MYNIEIIRKPNGTPDGDRFFDQWNHLIRSGMFWRMFKTLATTEPGSIGSWERVRRDLGSWERLNLIGYPYHLQLDRAWRLFELTRQLTHFPQRTKDELARALAELPKEEDREWNWDGYCSLGDIPQEWNNTVNLTALLVYESLGHAVTLRLHRRAGKGLVFCGVEPQPFLTTDSEFDETIEVAAAYLRSAGFQFDAYDYRWSIDPLEPDFSLVRVKGTSMGAAFALGFMLLFTMPETGYPSCPGPVAVTATVTETGRLKPICGFREKFEALHSLQSAFTLYVAEGQHDCDPEKCSRGIVQVRKVADLQTILQELNLSLDQPAKRISKKSIGLA